MIASNCLKMPHLSEESLVHLEGHYTVPSVLKGGGTTA